MKRILVVDDEPFIQQLLRDILQDEGYCVLFASGGRSMLELLKHEIPHLILLDVMMPDGNGREALQLMQAQPQLRDIPVVMMSAGLSQREVKTESVAFLGKPFELEHLLQLVEDTIGPAAENGQSKRRAVQRPCCVPPHPERRS